MSVVQLPPLEFLRERHFSAPDGTALEQNHVLPRSMVLDISTLFVAARAMGRVLFIIGVGSAAAQSGLLDKPARSCLANFNLNLFFPALYLSVAGHYGAYDLICYAPLWIGSLLHIALGYGLALFTSRLFGLQQQDKTFVLIMTAFGNCGGLPFVLMQAVCSSSWERVADMHEPVARAFVMMCARRPCARRAQPLPLPCRSRRPAPSRRQLYNVPWTLVAFTLGKATVERAAEVEAEIIEEKIGAILKEYRLCLEKFEDGY